MKFDNLWYDKHPLALALAPLSWLFCVIVGVRRLAYKQGLLTRHHAPVPVIVVGNITVGGTGKTPLVLWLAQFLKQHGFKPGIISRGYGGRAKKWPQLVHANSEPHLVGDEPVLLARHSGCPVAVAPHRLKAVQSLLENNDCNLIISDDGLQHYALHREIEIAVVDEIRRYGNRRSLPAGPLREPVSRLEEVDFIVTKSRKSQANPLLNETGFITTTNRYPVKLGSTDTMPSRDSICSIHPKEFSMLYYTKPLRRVIDDNVSQPLPTLRDHTVHAIAGIGHPAPFFNCLRENGLKLHCHEFPDHHHYCQTDIQFDDNLPVIMTEKDAVKCKPIAGPQHWYLPIEARLPARFGERLLELLS